MVTFKPMAAASRVKSLLYLFLSSKKNKLKLLNKLLGNKFCTLDEMKFEMSNLKQHHCTQYDNKTGEKQNKMTANLNAYHGWQTEAHAGNMRFAAMCWQT